MKRFNANLLVMTAVLLLVGGSLVFAGGQKESPTQGFPGAAQGNTQAMVAKELTTVTGQVQLANLIHPVIKSGAAEYELIVPRYDVYQAGVKNGQTITVKGYKVEGAVWSPFYGRAQTADNTSKLLVSSATVDGKAYDLSGWADHFKVALQSQGTYGYGPKMGYGPRGRGDFGRGPRGRGYGPGPQYGPGAGYGYGMMGPGFGPGMGYRFQGSGSDQAQ